MGRAPNIWNKLPNLGGEVHPSDMPPKGISFYQKHNNYTKLRTNEQFKLGKIAVIVMWDSSGFVSFWNRKRDGTRRLFQGWLQRKASRGELVVDLPALGPAAPEVEFLPCVASGWPWIYKHKLWSCFCMNVFLLWDLPINLIQSKPSWANPRLGDHYSICDH